MQVDPYVALGRDRGNRLCNHDIRFGFQFRCRWTKVDPQDSEVGNDIGRRSAIDLRRVHRQPGLAHRFESKREVRRGQNGVAAVLRIAPGMGRAPVDRDCEIAAARPRSRERPIGQSGRLVGQRRLFAARRRGDQRRGAERAHFLVAVEDDFIADAARRLARLDGLQGCQHDGDSALHVGDAGSVDCRVVEPAGLLERVVRSEHRVHVAREEQLQRRIGPHLQVQVAAVRDLDSLSGGIDRLHRCRVDRPDLARQCRECIGEEAGDLLQPVEIARPAVDRRPGKQLVEHRFGGRLFDGGPFSGRQFPHGSGS